MEVSQTALVGMLIAGILSGAVLGIIYDFLRLLRRAVAAMGTHVVPAYARAWKLPFLGCPGTWAHKNRLGSAFSLVITVICDVMFGFLCGIVVILLLYDRNDGIFRMSAPLGVAVGFFTYHFTAGRLTSAFSDVILFFAGLVFRYLFLIISFPFRLVGRGIGGFCKRFITPLIKKRRTKRMRRRSEKWIALLLDGAGTAYFGDE